VSQLSLFGTPAPTEPPASPGRGNIAKGKLYDLSITSLKQDPDQPRKYFDEQALAELQASIARHGVLQPILVRRGSGGAYIIVSGERRFQAARLAGLTTIPAILTDGNPAEISIIENLLRENLTAIEEAEAIEQLRTINNYQLSDLGTILGKAVSTLSEILSLNRLPEEVKDDCRRDPKTARGVLVEIARQKDPGRMVSLYRKCKENGLTRGEIRQRSAKPRTVNRKQDLAFVGICSEKIDSLDLNQLDETARAAICLELEKLRNAANRKLKQLKSQIGLRHAEQDQNTPG
jgi:ParB family chromosome partitioning protein